MLQAAFDQQLDRDSPAGPEQNRCAVQKVRSARVAEITESTLASPISDSLVLAGRFSPSEVSRTHSTMGFRCPHLGVDDDRCRRVGSSLSGTKAAVLTVSART